MNWFTKLFVKKNILDNYKCPLKLGLALSGGGTRGIAYIGVFKALNEAGIKFDYVAGTSVGSLMGATYCLQMDIDKMTQIAKELKVKDVISSKVIFVPSKTEKLQALIAEVLGNKGFDDMKIPYSAVAVDVITGKEVIMSQGNINEAIAGSCAVPLVFNPVEFEDKRLYDGGLRNNIPSDVVRNMGADIVLAIDINPGRGYGTNSTKYLEVLKAALRIMMKSNSISGYVNADYVLKVDLSQFNQSRLNGVEEMIEIGYQTTKNAMPEILKVLGMPVPNEHISETRRRIREMEIRAKNKEKNIRKFNKLIQKAKDDEQYTQQEQKNSEKFEQDNE